MIGTVRLVALIACMIACLAARNETNAQPLTVRVGQQEGSHRTLTDAIAHVVKEQRYQDVEIVIQPGRYPGESIEFKMPSHIRSLTINGNGSVFDGNDNTTTFLKVVADNGRKTGLSISDLSIKRYKTAIILYGSREDRSRSNSGTRIHHVHFEEIGSRQQNTTASTGVIVLFNSSDNTITDNIFRGIYNSYGCGAIHSFYVAHFSSRNHISGNHIEQKCGDPVRIRDQSNDNVFEGNEFTNAPTIAFFSEWFCDRRHQSNCTKISGECPSSGNLFRGNRSMISASAQEKNLHVNINQQKFGDTRKPPGCE